MVITSLEIEKLNNELFGPESKQWGDIPNFDDQRERSPDVPIEERVDYEEDNEDLYDGYYDDHFIDRQIPTETTPSRDDNDLTVDRPEEEEFPIAKKKELKNPKR
uniref:Uncharacterized protein n=1 Tax=Psilocybe cubensis TaxID=181762 RepID=A0A8H8CFA8_PSICU